MSRDNALPMDTCHDVARYTDAGSVSSFFAFRGRLPAGLEGPRAGFTKTTNSTIAEEAPPDIKIGCQGSVKCSQDRPTVTARIPRVHVAPARPRPVRPSRAT